MSAFARAEEFIEPLKELGRRIRTAVITARAGGAEMAGAARDAQADTLYAIDVTIEPVLEAFFEQWSREMPLVVIAEGLEDRAGREGVRVFPAGAKEADAAARIIVDPIDGTRGLMYDKRPAWFLAGAAPNRGNNTRLSDIAAAVQVEIPLAKQTLADTLWAVRGGGIRAVREDLATGKSAPLLLRPSGAETVLHGFASVSDFFPATKELAGRLADELIEACIGPADVTRATVFEDQYISTGGQMYELIAGHDRFVADVRPLLYAMQGRAAGLCVHPYDACTALIAREAGVVITDGLGGELDGPLDTTTGLSWAGYANAALRTRIEPRLSALLRNWLEGAGG